MGYISPEENRHNCQLCEYEWLGRCFNKYCGKDVSMDNEPCEFYSFGGSEERLAEIEANNKKTGIPYMYGGIDRVYTDKSIKKDISIDNIDKILDIVDDYIDLKEAVLESNKEE